MNGTDDRRTPLHKACGQASPSEVEALILGGAAIDARDNEQYTPLFYAQTGDVVDILIKHGANMNARSGWGNTPLIDAVEHGRYAVAERLILSGCDVNLHGRDGYTALH
jgi:uncharacterized protein